MAAVYFDTDFDDVPKCFIFFTSVFTFLLMKLGILITTYNRPAYLRECLDSLKRADLSGCVVNIIDDASTDAETIRLITSSGYGYMHNAQNKGIKNSLLQGCDILFNNGFDIVMNLDGDAIVRNDFVQRILEIHAQFPNDIVTGFNCLTKNRDGSERHKVIETGNRYNVKRSVGGINMCFNKEVYEKHIRPSLLKPGNWDHNACISSGRAVCVVPSVVQHIGVVSSMGHTSVEKPDTADDFKGLSLPDVTLICVDDNLSRSTIAVSKCTQDILFGDVQIITPNPPLGSKRAYSEFIMHEVYKYCSTSHMLIVQHDGYVKNWKAWNKDWLQYDYIGAPWPFHKDRFNVGNGGFSLRSRKLMELCGTLQLQNDRWITEFNEDHNICRIHRPYLESKGIKFAPLNVAAEFSIEGWGGDNRYKGQFGFHGSNVKF